MHERLGVLVGVWKTEGWTRETAGAPAAGIDATDSYEWLPGRFALLHGVDARVDDQKVEGPEIIGDDDARGSYVTQYTFDQRTLTIVPERTRQPEPWEHGVVKSGDGAYPIAREREAEQAVRRTTDLCAEPAD